VETQLKNSIFDAKAAYFIPEKETANKIFNFKENETTTFVNRTKHTLNIKLRVLKQFVGVFFSV